MKLKESEVKPEFRAKGIQTAAKELNILNLSEEERRQYDSHVGDVRDANSNLVSSFSEGKTKGLAEGEAKGEAKAIRNMHQNGLSIDQICKLDARAGSKNS